MAVSVSDLVVDTLASLAYALHEVIVHVEQDSFEHRTYTKAPGNVGLSFLSFSSSGRDLALI